MKLSLYIAHLLPWAADGVSRHLISHGLEPSL